MGVKTVTRPLSDSRWLGVLAIVLTACGESTDPSERLPTSAETGGTAVVGVASGATTLLPPLAAAALDFELGGSLFLPLNMAEWGEGGLHYSGSHPLALAQSWTFGGDGASLTYRLDASRRWSDGRPITAGDVAFTYALLSDPELALPLSSTTEQIDSVVVVNDSTITFFFVRAYPGMLFDTGVGIIPEHVYGGVPRAEMRGMPAYREPAASLVVSGPFGLAEWLPAERIVLERNPTAAEQPYLDRVVIRVMPDETARRAELRAGGLDLAQLNSFRGVRRLAEDSGFQVLRIEQRGFDYIAWNPAAHPAFADVNVRRALSLALDRSTMIQALDLSDYAEPAFGPYGSLFPHLATSPPDEPAFDPDRASLLLEASGWVDSNGDGVRDRDGVTLAFTLSTTAGNDRREDAVQLIQSQLSQLGIQADVRLEEFRSLLGRAMQGDYEAALLGWQVGLDPDVSMFWRDVESPFNLVRFTDVGVDSLIDRAQRQATSDSAAPYWREAADRIAGAYPYAWLWFFDLPFVAGPRVRGVNVDVTGFGAGMASWWIPAEEQRPNP